MLLRLLARLLGWDRDVDRSLDTPAAHATPWQHDDHHNTGGLDWPDD